MDIANWSAWDWAIIGAVAVLIYLAVAKLSGRRSKPARPVNAVNSAMIGQPCPKCGHYIGDDYKCDNPVCGYDLFTAKLSEIKKAAAEYGTATGRLVDDSAKGRALSDLAPEAYGHPAAGLRLTPVVDLGGKPLGVLDQKIEGSMDIIKRGECPDCGSRLDTRQVCTNPACGLDWSQFFYCNSTVEDLVPDEEAIATAQARAVRLWDTEYAGPVAAGLCPNTSCVDISGTLAKLTSQGHCVRCGADWPGLNPHKAKAA